MIYYQLNITLEFTAEADQHCMYIYMWMEAFVTQTLLMFLKMTQYQTHGRHIADILRSDPHQLSKTGVFPWVVASHVGQRITMGLAVPVAVSRNSHSLGQLHVMALV